MLTMHIYFSPEETHHIKLHAGIGRAIVKALAKYGARVIALSRTQADLDSLKDEVVMS